MGNQTMNDSDENVAQVKQQKPEADAPPKVSTQGITSLSEWAEFSYLIQKLDGEYADTFGVPLDAPDGFSLEAPKSSKR
jgi:hypothetical protein